MIQNDSVIQILLKLISTSVTFLKLIILYWVIVRKFDIPEVWELVVFGEKKIIKIANTL